MKTKKVATAITLFFSLYSIAQVGINTPSPEATLDVRATNHLGTVSAADGILVPRVNSLATNGTVNGQLVYLIADASPYYKGFHYWDGNAWTRVTPLSTNSWSTTGNSGTSAATNYIGTNDSNPLKFKIYNYRSGRIDVNNTIIGYDSESTNANLSNSTVFGAGSGNNINTSGAVILGAQNAAAYMTGGSNTVIGYYSGRVLSSGSQNIFIGESTANNISTGGGNIAIGNQAFNNTDSGMNNNIAIGSQAGARAHGNQNILLGASAGYTLSGNGNILIGESAGSQNSSNNNTMIGVNSGASAGNSAQNTYLGNSTGQFAKGSNNTALGYAALSASSASSSTANNTMIGSSSGASLSGQNNVAVGYNTAYSNKTGNGNTTIGTNSDVADNLSNATAIGQNSSVEASDAVVLGSVNGVNGAGTTSHVGIGTTKPNSNFQVVGGVSMSIKTINHDYNLSDKDYTIINNSDNSIIVNFPDPSDSNAGRIINLVNSYNGIILIITSGNSIHQINSGITATDNSTIIGSTTFQSHGNYWYQISRSS